MMLLCMDHEEFSSENNVCLHACSRFWVVGLIINDVQQEMDQSFGIP